jgi:hypothetical protein
MPIKAGPVIANPIAPEPASGQAKPPGTAR